MRPLIGITTSQSKNADDLPAVMMLQAYVYAVLQAGGAPVLLPSMLAEAGWEAVYARLDGLLFSGGADLAPSLFDGQPHPRIYGVDPLRDAVELSLFLAAVREGKPLLGICRGMQLVNVALGGSLYTHLPDQFPGALDHDYPGHLRSVRVHQVSLEPGTRLAEICGESLLQVNSLHHQGLKEVAGGLRVTAYAPDGLVEAVELPEHPFALAVQWHPEWLTDQQPTRNLFRAFVEAACREQDKRNTRA
ncbi:MAG: gamma-glutamyl-gamma-aminobutyrate hydrolase family protein [Anaerolineales bacterium]